LTTNEIDANNTTQQKLAPARMLSPPFVRLGAMTYSHVTFLRLGRCHVQSIRGRRHSSHE
jgi:hypothetical protein